MKAPWSMTSRSLPSSFFRSVAGCSVFSAAWPTFADGRRDDSARQPRKIVRQHPRSCGKIPSQETTPHRPREASALTPTRIDHELTHLQGKIMITVERRPTLHH
jgi:hypothetical protein